MFYVGLPRYLGLNSGRSVSINVYKTRKHFFRTIHAACMFPRGKHCFQWQFLFSSCKLCLRYTAGNFNENPSTQAFARMLRAQTSEHLFNFYEQFEQRTSLASTFKLDGTIRSPAILEFLTQRYKLRTQFPFLLGKFGVVRDCSSQRLCSIFATTVSLYKCNL